MPHFKAFGMMNLQYEIRICQKVHIKGTMSQWQIQVTIFLSDTDVSLGPTKIGPDLGYKVALILRVILNRMADRFGPCLDFRFQYALIRSNWPKTFEVEYWTLPGSNGPGMPYG
jgi:hypothetical protein